jgi:O-antigen ligase
MREALKEGGQMAGILRWIFRVLLTPVTVLSCGIVVGLLISRLPVLLTATMFGGVLALWLTCLRPDLALMLLFCGIVMTTDSAGPGGDFFAIRDVDIITGLPPALNTFFLMLFCITMVRTLFFEKRPLPISPSRLGLYMVLVLLALLTGLFRNCDRVLMRVDFMGMLFPVLCFYLCMTLLNSRERIVRMLTVLLAVSGLKALILAGFYLAGHGWPYEPTYRIATMDSADLLAFITLVLIVFHLLVRRDIGGFRAGLAVAACLPMLFVIVFAYRRAQWGGMILSMGLLYLGAAKAIRRRIAIVLAIALCASCALVVVSGIQKEKLTLIGSRLASIFDKTQGSNLHHRLESQRVMRDISQSPLFGLGLGGRHSGFVQPEYAKIPTNVVHNTFLYIWMKLGLPGVAFFVWAAILYGRRILRFRKQRLHDNAWGLLLPLAASSGLWLAMFLTGPAPWYFHQTFLLALFSAMGMSLILQEDLDSQLKPGVQP